MTRVQLDMPDWLAEQLPSTNPDYLCKALALGARGLRMADALKPLRAGTVSIGRAAEMAGVTHQEMAMFARAHGVEPESSEESIREELSVEHW